MKKLLTILLLMSSITLMADGCYPIPNGGPCDPPSEPMEPDSGGEEDG